jgi:hypothetical protein
MQQKASGGEKCFKNYWSKHINCRGYLEDVESGAVGTVQEMSLKLYCPSNHTVSHLGSIRGGSFFFFCLLTD